MIQGNRHHKHYPDAVGFRRALTDLMVDDSKLLRALADKRAKEEKNKN